MKEVFIVSFARTPVGGFGGSLSSEDDGFADISVTFRYDIAIKGTDIDTTPTA